MARLNYSDNVEASGRSLHLQTNTMEDTNRVVSTLFDGGRVLAKEERAYEADLSEDQIRDLTGRFHADRRESIERLYLISAKIKTVRHAQSMVMLGLLFLKWRLIDEAVSEFEYALKQDERLGEAYLDLGRAYLLRGGIPEAIDILRKGLETAPDYPDLHMELGHAFFLNRQHQEAVDALEAALRINDAYADAHYLLALVHFQRFLQGAQGSGQAADRAKNQVIEHLNRAVSDSKRFRIKTVAEGVLLIKKGDFEAALKKLRDTYRDISPEVDMHFHYEFYLNFLYGPDGRNPKHVQKYRVTLEKLLREHPDYPDLHNYMGVTALIQSRDFINHALQEFRTANRLNPDYQEAARNLKLTENDGKGFLLLLRAVLR